MIGFNKYLVLFIQIALVVATVIALVLFNPFNVFSFRKLATTETTTMLESIRSIGELISAEYYGEVIQSSTENLVDSIQHLRDSVKNEILGVEVAIRERIKKIENARPDLRRSRDVWSDFISNDTVVSKNPQYGTLFDLYQKVDRIKAINGLLGQNKQHILFFLYENQRNGTPFALPEQVVDKHVTDKFAMSRRETKYLESNKLVLLGRGWVKAGIDLRTFEAADLRYIKGEGRILMMRHQPKIVSATINPWFLPKEKIMGFEYILIGKNYKKGSDDPDQLARIQELKLECLAALEQQAIQANIIELAKNNAEQSLSNLFTLLLDVPIFVTLFGHPLDAYVEEFKRKDNMVTAREIVSLDSLVSVYLDTAFYETASFVKKMESVKCERLSKEIDNCTWSTRATYLTIVKDSLLTPQEQWQMRTESPMVKKKSYLYFCLLKEPHLLDSIFSNVANPTIDTLINHIYKKESLRNKFDEYRKMDKQRLITAVDNHTMLETSN